MKRLLTCCSCLMLGIFALVAASCDDAGAGEAETVVGNSIASAAAPLEIVVRDASFPDYRAPYFRQGVPYLATLYATGGSPGYTWQILSGTLPPGLSLATFAPMATIAGTPGTTPFQHTVVRFGVTDAAGNTADRLVVFTQVYIHTTIGIGAPNTQLALGSQGAPYKAFVEGWGGNWLDYHWTATGLPAGMTITQGTPAVVIEGTPQAAGTFSVDLTLTDSGGNFAARSFELRVIAPTARMALALPFDDANQFQKINLWVSNNPMPVDVRVNLLGGAGGPVNWQIVSGFLPAGLTLEQGAPAAKLRGEVNQDGQYPITLQVVDAAGHWRDFPVVIDVRILPPSPGAMTVASRLASTQIPTTPSPTWRAEFNPAIESTGTIPRTMTVASKLLAQDTRPAPTPYQEAEAWRILNSPYPRPIQDRPIRVRYIQNNNLPPPPVDPEPPFDPTATDHELEWCDGCGMAH
ncbi:MAG: putative Ig domain-containing protein [Planctomycetes bacterium]|nr:putative Ig domain-containing protein [Planctomycetota bacterium]